MENLRVLEGSEVFFRGLQHPDSSVQIRSVPLTKSSKTRSFRAFLLYIHTNDYQRKML